MSGLGLGVGWRRELARFIERDERIGFVEVLAEHLDPRAPIPLALRHLGIRGVKVVLHGVSLSLGGAEPPRRADLDRLSRLCDALGATCVSEHVCFVRAGGLDSGHLLPMPRTREALERLRENVARAQRALPVPLALENVAALFEWPEPEMDAAEFLTRLLEDTGAGLLLDLANLHANALNHGWNATEVLDRLPLQRLAYVHLAGGVFKGGLYHDTHAHPLPRGPLDLLARLRERTSIPGVLLERDDRFPPDEELAGELSAIAAVLDAPRPSCAAASPPRPAMDLVADGKMSRATPLAPVLAARQTALLQALLEGAPVPPGFDVEKVRASGQSLFRKKVRGVTKAWPALTRALGGSLEKRLRGTATHPALAGHQLARAHLRALPEAARWELLWWEARYVETSGEVRPRRGPALRAWVSLRPFRLFMVLRLPGLGERIFSFGGATRRRVASPTRAPGPRGPSEVGGSR